MKIKSTHELLQRLSDRKSVRYSCESSRSRRNPLNFFTFVEIHATYFLGCDVQKNVRTSKRKNSPSQRVREQSSGHDRVRFASFPRPILDERRLLGDCHARIFGTRDSRWFPGEERPWQRSPGTHSHVNGTTGDAAPRGTARISTRGRGV